MGVTREEEKWRIIVSRKMGVLAFLCCFFYNLRAYSLSNISVRNARRISVFCFFFWVGGHGGRIYSLQNICLKRRAFSKLHGTLQFIMRVMIGVKRGWEDVEL